MNATSSSGMGWSFRLGKVLGIDLYVHVTFFLLLAFVAMSHWVAGQGLAAALGGVVFLLSLFLCVVLHEFGHALAARQYGIATRDITLLPIGGVARLERMPDKPSQELVVALAGPLVNVVIALGLFSGLVLSGKWHSGVEMSVLGGSLAHRLLFANVFLVLFNLLPAFPMDGGRVLRSLLAMRLNYVRATRIAVNIGKGMAVVFGLLGLFGNFMLLLIALFVWMGATQESLVAEMKFSLAGARVREAMLTEFHSLQPQDPLGEAARQLLAGSQHDFPVIDNGRLVGLLTHADLFRALRAHGEDHSVSAAMQRDLDVLSPFDSLEQAMARERAGRNLVLPVLEGERLVGLLTPENLSEFLLIRKARALHNDRTGPPSTPPPLPTFVRARPAGSA
ncbi:MAG TPA: site-2 protease family protein [Verrucomicrobiae bacterium]|nr:site-2 protease family protein [Verrucomicrobiae bacterium]